jgi:hypothetical protein
MRRSKQHPYSITSSAATISVGGTVTRDEPRRSAGSFG